MAAFEPTVAVICPLSIELRAVLAVFDDPPQMGWGSDGKHSYYYGIISNHSAVAVCLPDQNVGVVPASRYGGWLEGEFPSLQHRFLVGIAGGIPDKKIDIRLGDIVIGTHICKCDSGKWVNRALQIRPILKEAPGKLQDAISMFKTRPQQSPDQLLEHELMNMRKTNPENGTHWVYPDAESVQDVLFEPGYRCANPSQDQCSCDQSKSVQRGNRQSKSPTVHYGLIASGDQVMKDDEKRDLLKDDLRKVFMKEVLAVEMEAAALIDLEYMVFRGICDYADSHKNKEWQEYAAATAAACFKTLLAYFHTPNRKLSNDHNPMILSSPNTWTHSSRTQSTSAVDMNSFVESEPGYTVLPNRPQNTFPQSPTSDFPKGPMSRASTHDETLETRGRGLGPAGPPLSPVARSSGQPDYTAGRKNPSFSQEHNQDSSSYPTVSNTIMTNTTSGTRSTNSVFKSHCWKWPLLEYCCDSKIEHQIESSKGEAAELRLIQEDIFNEPLKTSRIIEVYDAIHRADSFVSWIPLDGLQVGVQFDRVHLKYSNCNAQEWDTVNGMGQYKSTYNDRSPNISTNFVFLDSKSANEFASLILHIDCVLPGHHHLEEFRTLAGICRIGTAPEIGNQPSTSDHTQQLANIIINIDNHQDTRICSVFGLGSCFDYDFETSQGVITIILGQLRKVNYKTPTKTSPHWPPHWVRQNRYGSPAELDYHDSKNFAVSFNEQINNYSPWEAFMMKVTGWQVHSWQKVQIHGHDAQMVIWLRESSLRLLCKARVREDRQKWYCLDFSRNHLKQGGSFIGHGFGSKTLILRQVLCSEGRCIDRSMTTQPAQGPRQNKPSDERIKFTDKSKAQEFEAQIKQLLTPSNPRFLNTIFLEDGVGSSD